jgi:hypothetical protein
MQTRYRGAVNVRRAADLYAQGWTLRQIRAELGLTELGVAKSVVGRWLRSVPRVKQDGL